MSLKEGKLSKRERQLEKAFEDAENGKKGSVERLAKYIKGASIPIELHDELKEKYGLVLVGETYGNHFSVRDVQVPQEKFTKDRVFMKNLKDTIINSFGIVGLIIWYLISAIVMFLPLAFLDFSLLIDVLIILAIIAIPFIGDMLEFIIWVWSFRIVLSYPIDGWSIFYFFALAFYFLTTLVPYVANIVISLIEAIKELKNKE